MPVPTYTRGSLVTLLHSFVGPTGDPITPIDNSYPQVQIEDPNGAIKGSGVGLSTGTPGLWQWQYTIPMDGECATWTAVWSITDLQINSTVEKDVFRVVPEVIEQDGLDRTATYLTMKGSTERLIWKGTAIPVDLHLTFECVQEDVYINDIPITEMHKVEQDCYVMYYVDTLALTEEGDYLATWRFRKTEVSPWEYNLQYLIVPYRSFWFNLPHLRMLVDKLNKVTTTPLSYLDSELHKSMQQGLGLLNTVHPLTNWTWQTVPSVFNTWWVMCAGLWALTSRQILEIEVQHSACLTGDSLVSTPTGLREISAVVNEARRCPCCSQQSERFENQEGIVEGTVPIFCGDGSPVQTQATFRRKTEQVYKLSTDHGYTLTGTKDHRFLAIGPNLKVDWIKLDELTNSHWIAVPKAPQDSQPVSCPFDLDSLMENRGTRAIPPFKIPTLVTEEMARVMGYLVSEGVCNYHHYFSFCNADDRLHEDFQSCVREVFGLEPMDDKNSRTSYYNTRYSNTVARLALHQLGLEYEKADKKRIPWSIQRAPLSVARQFIRAFYDGDGDSDQLRVTSASRRLLGDLQVLLTRFGIISLLTERSDGYWRLSVPAGDHLDYAERVGFGFKQPPIGKDDVSDLWEIPYGMDLIQKIRSRGKGTGHYETFVGTTIRPTWDLFTLTSEKLSPSRLRTLLDDHQNDLRAIDSDVYSTLDTLASFNWSRVSAPALCAGIETVYDLMLPTGEGLLNHSYVAGGLVVHNSGQTVTLDYDHASPLSEIISRWQDMIRDWMMPAKLAAFRQSAGPGMVAVRPYRITYNQRVFRISQSAGALQDFPALLGQLGIWW